MKKDQSNQKNKSKQMFKYVFTPLSVGAILILPIALTNSVSQKQNTKITLAHYGAQQAGEVINGKQVINKTISESDLTFTGVNGEGAVALKAAGAGFEHLEVYFAKDLKKANPWTATTLTGLTNGETLYVRLAVKVVDNESYTITPNIVGIKVKGLSLKEIDNPILNIKNYGDLTKNKLDQIFFSFSGLNTQGKVYLNQKGIEALSPSAVRGNGKPATFKSPGFDERLEAQFSKDKNNWFARLEDLSNGEKIYARINVKPEFQNLYTVKKALTPRDPRDLYEPKEITVSDLIEDIESSKNKPLDFNAVKFTGENSSGSVSYEGFNKDEYKDGLTYSKTYTFISGYEDNGLKLPFDNNIYQSRLANGYKDYYNNYVEGTPSDNYRYLYPIKPVNQAVWNKGQYNGPIIGVYEPFIIQKQSPMKEAIVTFTTVDGGRISEQATPETYISTNYGPSYINWTCDLKFSDDGSFANAKISSSRGEKKDVLSSDTFTQDGRMFIYVGSGYLSVSSEQNRGYLYIDKEGNIGTGIESVDITDGENGLVVQTTVNKITYQDDSVWDASKDNSINNDLVNGEWVSVAPTKDTEGIKNDLNRKGVSIKVSGLTDVSAKLLPNLSYDFFEINKADGSLNLKASSEFQKNAKAINLLYSTDGINFTNKAPSNLVINDVVFIEQNLKPGQNHLALATPQVLKYVVQENKPEAQKITLPDAISNTSFEILANNNEVSAKLKDSVKLSSQVEVEWKVNDGPWINVAPTSLKNNDTFLARLKVKGEFGGSYKLNDSSGYETAFRVNLNNGTPILEKVEMATSNNTLSGGAIFGIVLGVLLGINLLAGTVYYLYSRFNNHGKNWKGNKAFFNDIKNDMSSLASKTLNKIKNIFKKK